VPLRDHETLAIPNNSTDLFPAITVSQAHSLMGHPLHPSSPCELEIERDRRALARTRGLALPDNGLKREMGVALSGSPAFEDGDARPATVLTDNGANAFALVSAARNRPLRSSAS
jgi:hypothetical protein